MFLINEIIDRSIIKFIIFKIQIKTFILKNVIVINKKGKKEIIIIRINNIKEY